MDLVAAAAAAASAGQMTQQPQQQQHQQQQQAHGQPQRVQKLLRTGHQYELLRQAKDLCDRQDYVDLTIYCEDGVVRAHQMLLATASPFLKLLFQTSPLYGNDEISLILPETKACLVQALVHFVYTGTVVSKEDHFYSLMKLVYALNINASIEAESTNAKPTTFSAPLVPYSMIESPSKRKLPFQHSQQQAPNLPPPITAALPTQPLMMPALPTQPNPPSVVLPTHPVPPSKIPKLSTSVAASTPGVVSLPTASLPTQPVPQASVASRMPATIQLPTQPIPMQGMVNGGAVPKNEPTVGQSQSYIAVDPNTGLSYKVELPNGPGTAVDASDPLAAIMNETIFTEASGKSWDLFGSNNVPFNNFLASFTFRLAGPNNVHDKRERPSGVYHSGAADHLGAGDNVGGSGVGQRGGRHRDRHLFFLFLSERGFRKAQAQGRPRAEQGEPNRGRQRGRLAVRPGRRRSEHAVPVRTVQQDDQGTRNVAGAPVPGTLREPRDGEHGSGRQARLPRLPQTFHEEQRRESAHSEGALRGPEVPLHHVR